MREKLHTQRLNLRPVKFEDAREIARLAGDPDIARMTGTIPLPYLSLAAEVWTMIAAMERAAGKLHVYALCLNDSDNIIGTAAIFPRPDLGWELGYWLGKPFWHKGLMREALGAVLDEADANLNENALHAGVYHDNPRSMALLENLGFTRTDKTNSAFCMARGTCVPLIHFQRTSTRAADITPQKETGVS